MKLQAGGIYALEAHNCARNHFVENKLEVDQFLIFINGYLKDYMSVLEYRIRPTGWHLLVRIKSTKEVLMSYQKLQLRKGKAVRFHEVWQIISERVRLFRSHFTKWVDKSRGREGNASKGVYRRFSFESLEEVERHIDQLRNSHMQPAQPNAKYQANKIYFDNDGQIAINKHILSSKAFQEGGNLLSDGGLLCLKICDYLNHSIIGWISRTTRIQKELI